MDNKVDKSYRQLTNYLQRNFHLRSRHGFSSALYQSWAIISYYNIECVVYYLLLKNYLFLKEGHGHFRHGYLTFVPNKC